MKKGGVNGTKSAEKCNLRALFLPAVGCLAGFVSGFFGAGGGVILMLGASLINHGRSTADSLAEVCTVTAALALASAVGYYLDGMLVFSGVLKYVIPAAIGGVAGATVLSSLGSRALKIIFGAVSALGGLIMIFF